MDQPTMKTTHRRRETAMVDAPSKISDLLNFNFNPRHSVPLAIEL